MKTNIVGGALATIFTGVAAWSYFKGLPDVSASAKLIASVPVAAVTTLATDVLAGVGDKIGVQIAGKEIEITCAKNGMMVGSSPTAVSLCFAGGLLTGFFGGYYVADTVAEDILLENDAKREKQEISLNEVPAPQSPVQYVIV